MDYFVTFVGIYSEMCEAYPCPFYLLSAMAFVLNYGGQKYLKSWTLIGTHTG